MTLLIGCPGITTIGSTPAIDGTGVGVDAGIKCDKKPMRGLLAVGNGASTGPG